MRDDVASLSTADLAERRREGIARRLEAETADERARAGKDLITVLREIRRREVGIHDVSTQVEHDGAVAGSSHPRS